MIYHKISVMAKYYVALRIKQNVLYFLLNTVLRLHAHPNRTPTDFEHAIICVLNFDLHWNCMAGQSPGTIQSQVKIICSKTQIPKGLWFTHNNGAGIVSCKNDEVFRSMDEGEGRRRRGGGGGGGGGGELGSPSSDILQDFVFLFLAHLLLVSSVQLTE